MYVCVILYTMYTFIIIYLYIYSIYIYIFVCLSIYIYTHVYERGLTYLMTHLTETINLTTVAHIIFAEVVW